MTIICGDFSYDKDEVNSLSKFLKSQDFNQLVTQPTHDGGRTLDQCYASSNVSDKIELDFHSPYYSDHDALCISLKL